MEGSFNKFRKAKFGGFNRKDVIDYIEKIQNEFFSYKKETDETVSRLREKISELEKLAENNGVVASEGENFANSEADSEKTADYSTADEITIATSKLKNVTDELCNSLNDFIDRLSENSIPVVLNVPFEEDDELSEIQETEQEEPVLSRVDSILSCASSIFLDYKSDASIEEIKATDKTSATGKDIKSILDNAGFIC